jgi:AraC-like DNA-binding protein
MKSQKNIFLICVAFILLFFVNCNIRENYKIKLKSIPKIYKHESIALSDLEVFEGSINLGIPNVDSPEWKPVKIPLIAKLNNPYFIYFMNYRCFWLRGKFKIDAPQWEAHAVCYGIRPGLVSATNIVYINNFTVGSFVSEDLNKLMQPGGYVIPAYVTLKETNEVYIRFVSSGDYITLISDILIQDEANYAWSEKWINFLYNQLPMGFCILLLGVSIILLYNSLLYKNKRYLFYSIYLFTIIISFLLVYSPLNILPFELSIASIYALVPFNMLLIIIIFQSFFGVYLWRQNIFSVFISVLVLIYIFTRKFFPLDIEAFRRLYYIIDIVFVFYLIYIIRTLNSFKQDRYKYYYSIIVFLALLILQIIQVIGVTLNIWYQHFYHLYSTPVLISFVIVFEARENKLKRIEQENLQEKFKRNGIEKNILTESAEKKIEKVIAYLNENFYSDISREVLASAVDLNPNYMSKLFSKHTGKKINEYINSLRIADAARQLCGSDNGKKVIDVALGVGFDSLSTFNRAFRNIYKITPTEYKKKNNPTTV